MKSKFLLAWLLLLSLMIFNVQAVFAQTYLFQVDKTEVQVYIHEDGTATIDYTIVFRNDPSADPMEYVDVGAPNSSFKVSNVSAWIGDVEISDIENSPYVTYGVAVGLGSNAIQPGQTGTLQVRFDGVKDMLYPASGEDPNYVSFQFSPNYFGSQYVKGTTDLTVTLVLPPGIATDQPRYFNPQRWPGPSEPITGMDEQGRPYYTWTSNQANSSTEYIFGASFPASFVPADAIVVPGSTTSSGSSGSGSGSGFSGFLSSLLPVACCFGMGFIILASVGLPIYSATIGANKRKLKYLPPKIKVEGHGIKRGLTPVETGILMELPMDRILTMILFACIKKGAVTVTKRDPLELQVAETLPEDMRQYEIDFSNAFKTASKMERTKLLQNTMADLITSVGTKMKGFSRKETIEYYQSIMEKAWSQVEAAETPEIRSDVYEDVMDWTMLDKNYDDRTKEVFTNRPIYVPMWWGRWDPTYQPASYSGPATTTVSAPSAPATTGDTFSRPTLPGSTFAASVVGGVQDFSNTVVGNVTSFTDKITSRTNPVPVIPSRPSSGGFRGGGGCACACACAGCACACAGGGR